MCLVAVCGLTMMNGLPSVFAHTPSYFGFKSGVVFFFTQVSIKAPIIKAHTVLHLYKRCAFSNKEKPAAVPITNTLWMLGSRIKAGVDEKKIQLFQILSQLHCLASHMATLI